MEDRWVKAVEGSPFGFYRESGERHLLADVTLLIPCAPPTFYAAGVNYPAHVAWAAKRLGLPAEPPRKADIGYRANNALLPGEGTVLVPRDSDGEVHYEGELVVVIGRQAKHLTPENALECVLGYSIGNDITERGWQSEDRTLWRAKNTDSFKPMGPWTTTGLDPMGLEVITRVNGVVVSRYETKNMIFTVVDYLVEVTKYLTLFPGDVMWMGCDGATGPIIPGDTVEVEVPGIGVLRNRVARE